MKLNDWSAPNQTSKNQKFKKTGGHHRTATSILTAYINLINSSKHYIYNSTSPSGLKVKAVLLAQLRYRNSENVEPLNES